MKLSEIIQATDAKIIGNVDLESEIKISTDTRTIENGDLYLPLKGANFDGEKFVEQAFEKGAIGAFCTTDNIFLDLVLEKEKFLLQVPDTLIAYLQLANFRRNKLNPKVVAITGSSGKTTTKEIIASVLETKYKVFKTPLNYNNEIGLCQTIFSMPDDTEILVLEMGMRGLGEIELLSKYAEPDITVISNVGTAHIGRLGSKENIARAKCEIVKYQRGNIFISHDNELIKKVLNFSGEKIFYSFNDVKIFEKKSDYSKFEYQDNVYELNIGGDFNIENALSAINVAYALNLSVEQIQEGLKNYKSIEKRWESVVSGGYQIVNDSYNANPESMKAFVDTVLELYENKKVLILGDMGELGSDEKIYHQEVGMYINDHKHLSDDITILTVGCLGKYISDSVTNCNSKHFATIENLVDYLQSAISQDNKIFLKASRSMKLERIIDFLGN